ncbi:hypothetical protein J537_0122 [Acinetobacter baumannii 1437282]|nr:hypothetical protein J537_0122 [Acinetobacter baumannii 1437282]
MIEKPNSSMRSLDIIIFKNGDALYNLSYLITVAYRTSQYE